MSFLLIDMKMKEAFNAKYRGMTDEKNADSMFNDETSLFIIGNALKTM